MHLARAGEDCKPERADGGRQECWFKKKKLSVKVQEASERVHENKRPCASASLWEMPMMLGALDPTESRITFPFSL